MGTQSMPSRYFDEQKFWDKVISKCPYMSKKDFKLVVSYTDG